MKVHLRITKHGTPLYTGTYDIADADSFGKACADAWFKLQQQQMQQESSIGALMEHLDNSVLDQLHGAHIILHRA
jgi:hypothetical protein